MTPRIIPVELFDLVVFGATGDLSQRKLLPALFHRDLQGQIPPGSRIIGCSRRAMTNDEFQAFARKAIEDHVPEADRPADVMGRFLERVSYVTADAAQDAGWADLGKVLKPESHRIRVFYLAVGPDLFGPICDRLGAYHLVTPQTRVVIEKPLGKSGASAHALNESIGKVFKEPQIYRIDHYLGKETVQNLLALRFANSLFEPLWNAGHIDHVQITIAETVGLEGRLDFYDGAGALRDMVQNHMLQLLALVAMEPPGHFGPTSVRDEKVKVLNALRRIDTGNVAAHCVTGQYGPGVADGKAVPGYAEELGHASDTETFVALKANIDNWRWKGVPFYLRTGKRLPSRASQIVIQFKPVPHLIFDTKGATVNANKLVIELQPNENIRLMLMTKTPGLDRDGIRLREVPLDIGMDNAFADTRRRIAHERLLLDLIEGRSTLFVRRDEVEAQWRWIDGIRAALLANGIAPKPYAAGSWGPSAAIGLAERDGVSWHD